MSHNRLRYSWQRERVISQHSHIQLETRLAERSAGIFAASTPRATAAAQLRAPPELPALPQT